MNENQADEPGTEADADVDPERTCVGCRAHAEAGSLLRFAFVPEHEPPFVPDLGKKLGGRGAWLHASTSCFQKAARGGFSRAMKRQVQVDAAELRGLAAWQIERRIQGLLLACLQRRTVAVGSDAVLEALATCRVSLLLVAKDAAGRRSELIARASDQGIEVVELFDKESFGRLAQRQELSFIALLDSQIALEIVESGRSLAGLSEDG